PRAARGRQHREPGGAGRDLPRARPLPGEQPPVSLMPGRPSVERWLFTCEHGGRTVPGEFAHLFRGAGHVLGSHRGWDPGALDVFNALAPALGAAAFPADTTRLLIDLNRSLHHPRVFSEFTRQLPPAA